MLHTPKRISSRGLGGAALWLLGLLTACHREPAASTANPASLPAVPVSALTLRAGSRPVNEEVVGTVRARARAVIEAKVSGRVVQLPAAPGLEVKAGQVLVELEAPEVRARVEQARAVLQQADKDRARLEVLLKQEAVTQAEFDAVDARFRVARSAVAEAESLLAYLTVTAPFAGVVTRKLAEVGDLAAPGRALLEVEDPHTLRFEADIAMTALGRVKLGDRLSVTVGAPERVVEGVVSEIEPSADPVSRTFRVKLDLPPAAEARSGMFGRLGLPGAANQVLAIPSNAVAVRGQMELAYVVTNGRAQLRLVRLGKRLGGDVEILSGLEAGETVVAEGIAGLVDGQPVQVR